MNYRHAYHAGGFADTIKHLALIALINSLSKKDSPFFYLDTHAGRAWYDLQSEFSEKTKEHEEGISKLIHASHPPTLVQQYLNCIKEFNRQLQPDSSALRYYPGSTRIAYHFIRPHDRIVACEWQPREYEILKTAYAANQQISCLYLDAYVSLKSLLPPKERRGLVLIDPPYENVDEFSKVLKALSIAKQKWQTGIYAIWYPIKELAQIQAFHRSLKQLIADKDILIIELNLFPPLAHHLSGSGLCVINPPWQFKERIDEALPWVWKSLTINHQGGYQSYLLK